MINTAKKIINYFCIDGEIVEVKPITTGLINTTFRLTVKNADKEIKYTLQTINKYVFKNPDVVMENIVAVTEFLRDKIKANGGDAERECLTVIKTKDGKPYYLDENGEYWRVYIFIDKSYTVNAVNSPEELRLAAEGFGKFQAMLSDFPMEKLKETIVGFHNTKSRYDQLMAAVEEDAAGRVKLVQEEINFLKERYDEMCSLVKMTEDGILPLRVVHNDTKFNNILIDEATGMPLCVIDLDTVMPGLSVMDFGDAVRFAANHCGEDETDPSKIYIDMELYKAFAEGFMSKVGNSLTKAEIRCMPLGAKVITLEQTARFLADYINGDKYFKTSYDNHNLDRARCQMLLAISMEENMNKMNEIIEKYL